jgi:siroheme synthase (precorrin-2 oxidase/ferrochelatase)
MALFPFFMNIENKVGIITGGGKHALEKIERMCYNKRRLRKGGRRPKTIKLN